MISLEKHLEELINGNIRCASVDSEEFNRAIRYLESKGYAEQDLNIQNLGSMYTFYIKN